jgi:hypothetical protein
VSIRKLLGRLLVFAVMEFGALAGNHITQEEIEKVMNMMHRVKVVKIVKTESD